MKPGRIQSFFLRGLIALFLALPLAGGAGDALAQKANDPLNAKEQPLDMSKVPEAYLEEALAFNDKCAADPDMQKYYDCECLSFAFLNERVKQGKIPSGDSIFLRIQRQCRDATMVSGETYQECLNTAAQMEPGTDPEAYCTCVANTYVSLLDQIRPGIDSRNIVRYKVQSRVICQDPARARQIYPQMPRSRPSSATSR